jgi:hypothetical protein
VYFRSKARFYDVCSCVNRVIFVWIHSSGRIIWTRNKKYGSFYYFLFLTKVFFFLWQLTKVILLMHIISFIIIFAIFFFLVYDCVSIQKLFILAGLLFCTVSLFFFVPFGPSAHSPTHTHTKYMIYWIIIWRKNWHKIWHQVIKLTYMYIRIYYIVFCFLSSILKLHPSKLYFMWY